MSELYQKLTIWKLDLIKKFIYKRNMTKEEVKELIENLRIINILMESAKKNVNITSSKEFNKIEDYVARTK